MSRDRRLLIVIADGEHARFVRPDPNLALHTEQVIDSEKAHLRASALGADRPGATFHSDSSAHHALAPRHEPQALEQEKFARRVAHALNAAAARDEFRDLVLVGPPRVLAAVRDELDRPTAAHITGLLSKDLTKVPDSDLQPHLGQWVRPPRREH